ncbi:alginate lyase family protein [Gilvimarinus xylanilyticus]|uniref:Alginate lyase family protein n=1 Tax=Gilvimarinus xylanilyticus TaxID=2944139 RepID=A0A9X2KUI7_9GAMM|nr:alginate lyase family protein [Gilvimarinus xylanilyticus]MCP8899878.1 alginate lyase family protein [Gilvimarinus xylanilyticus]
MSLTTIKKSISTPLSMATFAISALALATLAGHNSRANTPSTPQPASDLSSQWQQQAQELTPREAPALAWALAQLTDNADKLVASQETYSVTFNTATPPSGNPRDYTSTGPYWWPNPATDDGLPWVRKDGVVNRQVRGRQTDSSELNHFSLATGTLAQAYAYTQNEAYARKAAELMEVFLFDTTTGMTPNFRYAQAIPGITDGRGIGIIESRKFISVIKAHTLLQNSSIYRHQIADKLNNWIAAYLQWLLTSPNGIEESRTHNNHASFYDYQIAYFAQFIGDHSTLYKVLDKLYKKRIQPQIEPGGKQPHELERTRPYHYSVFNLEAFWGLALLAADGGQLDSVLGPSHHNKQVPLMVQALDYVNQAQFSLLEQSNYASDSVSREPLIQVNLIAGYLYDQRFKDYAKQLMLKHGEYDCALIYPVQINYATDSSAAGAKKIDKGDGLCQL